MKKPEDQSYKTDIVRQLASILETSERLGPIYRENSEEIILGASNDFQEFLAKENTERPT